MFPVNSRVPLPFRQRILVVLIALGAVPTATVIFGWAFAIPTNNPATAARAAVVWVLLGTLASGPGRRALEHGNQPEIESETSSQEHTEQ